MAIQGHPIRLLNVSHAWMENCVRQVQKNQSLAIEADTVLAEFLTPALLVLIIIKLLRNPYPLVIHVSRDLFAQKKKWQKATGTPLKLDFTYLCRNWRHLVIKLPANQGIIWLYKRVHQRNHVNLAHSDITAQIKIWLVLTDVMKVGWPEDFWKMSLWTSGLVGRVEVLTKKKFWKIFRLLSLIFYKRTIERRRI